MRNNHDIPFDALIVVVFALLLAIVIFKPFKKAEVKCEGCVPYVFDETKVDKKRWKKEGVMWVFINNVNEEEL